ncbi:MAG: hypothetical protein JXB47_04945 [Anaerolineae bacterium]|nr:hypothetical protein [Anaerolineae bacterium]
MLTVPTRPAAPEEPGGYHRYHLNTQPAPPIVPLPDRFLVKVKRPILAWHIIADFVEFKGNWNVTSDRPCVYGVLDSPLGGMMARPHLCVACLRCTMQNPELIQIHHNPDHQHLGDSYFTSEYFAHVAYQAETGRIPVKGAGYRGKFGGEGWDGMWTDMSEIVRPTRDGIHGREFISTAIDIGAKPGYLRFNGDGTVAAKPPRVITTQVPFLFDLPPIAHRTPELMQILGAAAAAAQTLAIVPLPVMQAAGLSGAHLAPLVKPGDRLDVPGAAPHMVELDGWDPALYDAVTARFPEALVALRLPADTAGAALLDYAKQGVRVFHIAGDYHGRASDGRFMREVIRAVHGAFVDARLRDEITLLGSGGIAAAEHVAKAIICGLDAAALDIPLLVALDARFRGECIAPGAGALVMPPDIPHDWGVQRLINLTASWHDQLLEVLGAMGLRDVRRLRGELGRAMFQEDLEREAFGGIAGYDDQR